MAEQEEQIVETSGYEQDTEMEEITPKSDPTSSESRTKTFEQTHSFSDICLNFLYSIYQSRYYRNILKSVLVFLVALKMAQESKKMLIPLKEYEPFRSRL